MNPRLIELAERRGRLCMQSAQQRTQLAVQSQPVARFCAGGDRVLDGVNWLKGNPVVVGAAVLLTVLVRPARAWRWGRRGWQAWRAWKALNRSVAERF